MGATRLQIIRGTDAQRQTVTFLVGELAWTTDLKELWVGDGATLGGVGPFRGLSGVVGAIINDTAPGATSTYSSTKIAELLAALEIAWDKVTGKPETFPPSAHGHDWSEITNEPLAYPPEAHSHAIADVTGLEAALESAGGGHTIQDEGVALTQRANLDFVGAGVVVTDDQANDKTIVTIEGGGGGGGGAVGDWTDAGVIGLTATTTNPTKGTTSTDKMRWRRVGDSAEIEFEYVQTAIGQNGAGTYLFALPAGLVADLTKIGSSSYPHAVVGHGYVYYDLGSGPDSRNLAAFLYDNQHVYLSYSDTGNWDHTNVGATNYRVGLANYKLTFRVTIPIVGWSSNIQLASAATEYAFNTDTTNASCTDDLHYGAGAAGALTPRSNPAGVSIAKRVQFATAIQASDVIVVEVDPDGNGRWQPGAVVSMTNASPVEPFRWHSTLNTYVGYGGVQLVAGSDKKLDILFGKYKCGTNSTDGNWDHTDMANTRWRVRKSSGASMAEIPTDVIGEVQAYPSADQGIGAATLTKLNFGTEVMDTRGEFADSRFTAKTAGRYQIIAKVDTAEAAAHALNIKKNGVSDNRFGAWGSPSGSTLLVLTFDLAIGDYLEAFIYSTSGCTVYAPQTYLSVVQIPRRRLV